MDPKDPRDFLKKTPAPPAAKRVDEAFQKLTEIGAIAESYEFLRHPHSLVDHTGASLVTHLGRIMRKLTFDMDVVRLIVNGLRYGVLEEAEILAGILRQNKNPFLEEHDWPSFRLQAVRVKMACSTIGDPIAKLRAVQIWQR